MNTMMEFGWKGKNPFRFVIYTETVLTAETIMVLFSLSAHPLTRPTPGGHPGAAP